MFRLRCHNFELTKPASWGLPKTSLSAREVLSSISGPILVVSLVVKRQTIGAEGLGLDSWAGQIGTVSPTARQCCDVSVFPSR